MSTLPAECDARCKELANLIANCAEAHGKVERRILDLEEKVLKTPAPYQKTDGSTSSSSSSSAGSYYLVKKFFPDLTFTNWATGSQRQGIRHSIEKYILDPCQKRMEARTGYIPFGKLREKLLKDSIALLAADESEDLYMDEIAPPILERIGFFPLLELQLKELLEVFDECKKADVKLQKRIRRQEKEERETGKVTLGIADSRAVQKLKSEQPVIWNPAVEYLDKFTKILNKLKQFLEDDLKEDSVLQMLDAVAPVVCRAVCEWYFQDCYAKVNQVERWWTSFAMFLQANRLDLQTCEQDKHFLQGFKKNLECLNLKKHSYLKYTDFGATELVPMPIVVSHQYQQVHTGNYSSFFDICTVLPIVAALLADLRRLLAKITDSAIPNLEEAALLLLKRKAKENAPGPYDAISDVDTNDWVKKEFVVGILLPNKTGNSTSSAAGKSQSASSPGRKYITKSLFPLPKPEEGYTLPKEHDYQDPSLSPSKAQKVGNFVGNRKASRKKSEIDVYSEEEDGERRQQPSVNDDEIHNELSIIMHSNRPKDELICDTMKIIDTAQKKIIDVLEEAKQFQSKQFPHGLIPNEAPNNAHELFQKGISWLGSESDGLIDLLDETENVPLARKWSRQFCDYNEVKGLGEMLRNHIDGQAKASNKIQEQKDTNPTKNVIEKQDDPSLQQHVERTQLLTKIKSLATLIGDDPFSKSMRRNLIQILIEGYKIADDFSNYSFSKVKTANSPLRQGGQQPLDQLSSLKTRQSEQQAMQESIGLTEQEGVVGLTDIGAGLTDIELDTNWGSGSPSTIGSPTGGVASAKSGIMASSGMVGMSSSTIGMGMLRQSGSTGMLRQSSTGNLPLVVSSLQMPSLSSILIEEHEFTNVFAKRVPQGVVRNNNEHMLQMNTEIEHIEFSPDELIVQPLYKHPVVEYPPLEEPDMNSPTPRGSPELTAWTSSRENGSSTAKSSRPKSPNSPTVQTERTIWSTDSGSRKTSKDGANYNKDDTYRGEDTMSTQHSTPPQDSRNLSRKKNGNESGSASSLLGATVGSNINGPTTADNGHAKMNGNGGHPTNKAFLKMEPTTPSTPYEKSGRSSGRFKIPLNIPEGVRDDVSSSGKSYALKDPESQRTTYIKQDSTRQLKLPPLTLSSRGPTP